MVRGSVRRRWSGARRPSRGIDAAVLGEDDLKVVIPAVERLLIDRVLRDRSAIRARLRASSTSLAAR